MSPAAPSPTRRHRPDIEGLRAIAVLLVVAFHAGVPGIGGGFVGVDVFFVLSGYLITGLLAEEVLGTGRVSFARFYGRRARRLLPMSAVVLLATAAACAVVLPPLARPDLAGDLRAAALWSANWRFGSESMDYMSAADKSPVLHFWSLSVEEQFYVVWPLLLMLVARGRGASSPAATRRRMLGALAAVAALSFAASALLTRGAATYAYYGLHTRAWELAAGGLLALVPPGLVRVPTPVRGLAGWAGLAGILVAALHYTSGTPFPGTAALLPVGAAVLLVAAGQPTTAYGVPRLLSARPLTYVGRISYSWYLWHWPCLVLAAALVHGGAALVDGEATSSPARGWGALGAVVVSFALAVASHHLIEDPVRRNAWLAAVRVRSLALGGALTAAAVAGVALLLPAQAALSAPGSVIADVAPLVSASPSPSPKSSTDPRSRARVVQLSESATEAAKDKPDSRKGCYAGRAGTEASPDCQFGDPKGSKVVVLLGDSHAQQWLPALQVVAQKKHWQLWMWVKPNCTVTSLTVRVYHDDYAECPKFNASVDSRLRSLGHIDLILVGRISTYPEYLAKDGKQLSHADALAEWGRSWATNERRLAGYADHVALLRDTPHPSSNVPACVSQHEKDVRPCSFPRRQAFAEEDELAAAERAAVKDVSVVDMTSALCPATTCPVVYADGTIIYRDENHVGATMSVKLAPVLGPQIDRLLRA